MNKTYTAKMVWGSEPDFYGPRDWFRNSLIIEEVKRTKKIGKLLDFGCGSGQLLKRFSRLGYDCTGIDVSSVAIQALRNKIKNNELSSNIKSFIGTQKILNNFKKKFDVITCGETLEHIKNDTEAVIALYRSLKLGGVCVVTVPAHLYLWDYNDEYSSHFRRYELDDIKKKFTSAGFTIDKITYFGFPLSYLWHKFLYLPLVVKKSRTGDVFSNPTGLFGRFLRSESTKRIVSLVFYFDNLFNWTNLGCGLLIVAKK